MVEKNDFIGYEYREVHTKRGLISVYVDGYENSRICGMACTVLYL